MDRTPLTRPSSSLRDSLLDTSPLVGSGNGSRGIAVGRDEESNNARRGSISGAARFLRRSGGWRMMREPSMQVRETAAEELEERHNDWAYSKPVVALDLIWNFAFVVATIVVLGLSPDEKPRTPLRVWLSGYILQCVLHMICVCFEYRRRRQQIRRTAQGASQSSNSDANERSHGLETHGDESPEVEEMPLNNTSLAKRLESANTIFSFVWWIIGFYWITAGGETLSQKTPQLYWLCIVFLAFDIFFVVFCLGLACIIGIAVCCCLPCIIAILYAVTDQEGAAEEDISSLPKFRFQRTGSFDKINGEKLGPFGGVMSFIGSLDYPRERKLSAEDAECCICLSAYDDGVELRELPCSHHFHCTCIDKWLRINATCPLCKYNIIKSSITTCEDV